MKRNEYYSSKYLETFTQTKSLSKLDKLMKDDYRLRAVATVYVFYSKKETLLKNKYKYKFLYQNYLELLDSTNNNDPNNDFVKAINSVKVMSNKHSNDLRLKKQVRTEVLKLKKKSNVSLNYVSRELGLKHSNLYSFLNEEYKNLSKENSMRLLRYMRQLDEWFSKKIEKNTHMSVFDGRITPYIL